MGALQRSRGEHRPAVCVHTFQLVVGGLCADLAELEILFYR